MASQWRAAFAILAWLSMAAAAQAAPLAERDVPAPLKPWIGWVLYGQEPELCPPLHDNAVQKLCVWPGQLQLKLDAAGGRFTLQARLDAPGWLVLPGSEEAWPQDVQANGRAAPVLSAHNAPSLYLPAGEHRVNGAFAWKALPEALQLPAGAGLVELEIENRAISHPARDPQGRLWLGRSALNPAAQDDHLDLRVFRLVEDGIPLRVVTRLQIEAGGAVREETIGPVLLPGLLPLSLEGNLPARLEDDGRLRLQLRPGLWTLTLTARAPGPIAQLDAPVLPAPWPQQEVWSFLAHPELRVVELSGAPAVDPRQTAMPEEWQAWPAFLLDSSGSLKLEQKQRGLSATAPDQLELDRQLWLDFDGEGFSVQDRLSGTLASRWRLETLAPIAPGRVEIDGQPQLITRLGDRVGVEVRHGNLQLVADSRVDTGVRRLPAAGWNLDLQSVETRLHLPPGWRLFAAPGADAAPDSWLRQWTLLDLFLVLIAGIAALRVFGPLTGALSLFTLVLIWHQPGAPRYAWLNLIAVIALLRALPEDYLRGRLQAWLDRYRWVSAAALVLIALPFALEQARSALHPQLEIAGAAASGEAFDEAAMEQNQAMAPEAMPRPAAPPMAMDMEQSVAVTAGAPAAVMRGFAKQAGHYAAGKRVAQQNIQQLDPKANVQTGPGVPQWSWREARLSWSGPVTAEQTFTLWLMPPWLTRFLRLLSIVLIALVLWRWMRPPGAGGLDRGWRLMHRWPGGASAAAALLLGMGLATPEARAQVAPEPPPVPPPMLLDELRARLLAPPDCMPACAQIARLALEVRGDALNLRLRIDAQIDTAVPLPVPPLAGADQGGVWQAQTVLLDGAPASLRRADNGSLWLRVPAGRHQVAIAGSLAGLAQLRLPMPLTPRRAEIEAPGWRVSGVDAQLRPGAVIELQREAAEAGAPADAGTRQALPPFLSVTRSLSLGPDWDVTTTVERVGSSAGALVTALPLLPGEVITGESVRTENGAVLLSLAPGQDSASWNSRLPLSAKIEMIAPKRMDVYETWRFDVSPLWHAEFSGLPAVQDQENGYRLPTYRPWPGETLAVNLARPQGVDGQVLTLDRSTLSLRPGKRVSDLQLDLSLRASQGGQHALRLPPDIEVQDLSIDGVEQAARIESGTLILPLHPGAQHIALSLRRNSGVSWHLRTPALNVGLPGVNAHLAIDLPEDRWVLWTSGPRLGPAVLFWAMLAVFVLIAYGLSRLSLTPLSMKAWMLLMVGLSQLPVWGAAVVVGWLLALGARGRIDTQGPESRFNLMQLALVLLSFAALALLFGAVAQGLLGAPDMQVEGNGSYGNALRWFQDRHAETLPQASVLSVSIWVYRLLMLLWALWLANSLLGWLRWGWTQFSRGGLWRKKAPAVDSLPPLPPETPIP